jgi:hypothetical protein
MNISEEQRIKFEGNGPLPNFLALFDMARTTTPRKSRTPSSKLPSSRAPSASRAPPAARAALPPPPISEDSSSDDSSEEFLDTSTTSTTSPRGRRSSAEFRTYKGAGLSLHLQKELLEHILLDGRGILSFKLDQHRNENKGTYGNPVIKRSVQNQFNRWRNLSPFDWNTLLEEHQLVNHRSSLAPPPTAKQLPPYATPKISPPQERKKAVSFAKNPLSKLSATLPLTSPIRPHTRITNDSPKLPNPKMSDIPYFDYEIYINLDHPERNREFGCQEVKIESIDNAVNSATIDVLEVYLPTTYMGHYLKGKINGELVVTEKDSSGKTISMGMLVTLPANWRVNPGPDGSEEFLKRRKEHGVNFTDRTLTSYRANNHDFVLADSRARPRSS